MSNFDNYSRRKVIYYVQIDSFAKCLLTLSASPNPLAPSSVM